MVNIRDRFVTCFVIHTIIKSAKSVVTAMSRSDTIHDPVSKYAELGPGGEARHGTDTFTAEPGPAMAAVALSFTANLDKQSYGQSANSR